ncbi:MAG: phage tail protein [Kiloniellales bacterium]
MPERPAPVRLAFDAKKIDALLRAGEEIAARGAGLRVALDGADAAERALVAERLAKARGLKLQRIDLSEVVSKGIGETEKTLKALFARADAAKALLFFDEADALFGRRSAVRDSHDRYANLETSFLSALGRYKGAAVVAVAAPAAGYAAFVRTADLLVDFRRTESAPSSAAWDEPLPNLHFLVIVGDLEIGFCSVSGLGDASEILQVREGDEPRSRRKVAGEAETETLVLRRALSRSKDLYHWRRAILDGKDDRRTVELLQLPAPGAKPVNRWRFLDCWPCRWSGPDFDALEGGLAYEEVELSYERFEWL